jgi:Protein of unknown function (DUF3037)
MSTLPAFTATRYVQPLREGGSLPAIVDTHGGGLFVAKFRGAGQGAKSLIAELIVGLLAQAAGLPTPELALIDVAESFGPSERFHWLTALRSDVIQCGPVHEGVSDNPAATLDGLFASVMASGR